MSCGCSVVLSVFMLLLLNSHFNSGRPRLGGHELYCPATLRISFILYTINVALHAHGQDRTVAVWDMNSLMNIFLREVLRGHTESVRAVDFDDKYIVSGSYDSTIKVCVGEGREREGWRGRKGRRQRRRGSSMHPLSSCHNFLIVKLFLSDGSGRGGGRGE